MNFVPKSNVVFGNALAVEKGKVRGVILGKRVRYAKYCYICTIIDFFFLLYQSNFYFVDISFSECC